LLYLRYGGTNTSDMRGYHSLVGWAAQNRHVQGQTVILSELFDLESKVNVILRNVSNCTRNDTASHTYNTEQGDYYSINNSKTN
jgi:hypothetical protein